MKTKEYVSPNLKFVRTDIRGIICTSDDPEGNVSNEGYTETDFDW